MAVIDERDGKLIFEYKKKGSMVDLKDVEQALRELTKLIVMLDLRLQILEERRLI